MGNNLSRLFPEVSTDTVLSRPEGRQQIASTLDALHDWAPRRKRFKSCPPGFADVLLVPFLESVFHMKRGKRVPVLRPELADWLGATCPGYSMIKMHDRSDVVALRLTVAEELAFRLRWR